MEVINIKELNEHIESQSVFVDTLRAQIKRVIVGQSHLVDTLLIGLLSDGHILLEGVPGLAKTLAITTLAKAVDADFARIQFTPDLLPADLLGTLIYSQKNEDFTVRKGPVFANFILADEINRAPAKVQSALLEAMQEHQVTIGDETYPLSRFWCWPRRTRWSRRAPIRCPRRRSTASCSKPRYPTPSAWRSSTSSA